jgi:hypothetical protein
MPTSTDAGLNPDSKGLTGKNMYEDLMLLLVSFESVSLGTNKIQCYRFKTSDISHICVVKTHHVNVTVQTKDCGTFC